MVCDSISRAQIDIATYHAAANADSSPKVLSELKGIRIGAPKREALQVIDSLEPGVTPTCMDSGRSRRSCLYALTSQSALTFGRLPVRYLVVSFDSDEKVDAVTIQIGSAAFPVHHDTFPQLAETLAAATKAPPQVLNASGNLALRWTAGANELMVQTAPSTRGTEVKVILRHRNAAPEEFGKQPRATDRFLSDL